MANIWNIRINEEIILYFDLYFINIIIKIIVTINYIIYYIVYAKLTWINIILKQYKITKRANGKTEKITFVYRS